MSEQDTGKFRTNSKDQFYTNRVISKKCVDLVIKHIPHVAKYTWVEPSAGTGSFTDALDSRYKRIAMDIDPKSDTVKNMDFLEWKPTVSGDVIVFGNPPFGKQSSLAKAFIKKSCTFANVIAFILPKSFTKPSMNNAFEDHFHLVHTHELEKNAFEVNGKEYDVPCVFQVWQKRDRKRRSTKSVEPVGFRYVKPGEVYDLAFRRVGVYAGRCYLNDGRDFSVQSHHFIKLDTDHIDVIMTKVNAHTFPSNTVGPRSLTKTEINTVLNKIIKGLGVE
jgi:hypothetical protein